MWLFSLIFLPAKCSELLLRRPFHRRNTSSTDTFLQAAAIAVPTEITATSILVTFWDSNVSFVLAFLIGRGRLIVGDQVDHLPIYIVFIILFAIGINFLGVRYFGEGDNLTCLTLFDHGSQRIFSRVRVCDRQAWVQTYSGTLGSVFDFDLT